MEQKALKVAVVGCGRMGALRMDAARSCGAQVVAIFDVNEDLALCAAEYPEQVVSSPMGLPLAQLDAVFICTPPSERGPVESSCIKAGVPFFVEKPIGLNAEAGAGLVDSIRDRSGGGIELVTAVGYMNRHRASVLSVRAALQREQTVGIIGRWACGPYARDWWRDPIRSGGPINEQATHMIDLFRFLGGEITEVAGTPQTSQNGNGFYVGCALTLRFEAGHLGTLLYSCEAVAKSIGLRVITATGTHTLEGWDLRTAGVAPDADIFRVETQAFLAAVQTGCPVNVGIDFAEALRTQRVVDGIHEALRTGLSVPIPR